MKRKIALALLLAIMILLAVMGYAKSNNGTFTDPSGTTLPAVSAQSKDDDGCPDGSYNIGLEKQEGQPICKLEPTGCPYGDSIPLGPECDKHAPTATQNDTPAVQGASDEPKGGVTMTMSITAGK